jgi:hypothetical protein
LDGVVNSTDYNIWLSSAGGAKTRWQYGDFNDDNIIDDSDYNIFLAVTSIPGDYNQDGTTDAADYVVWRKGPSTIFTQTGLNVWQAHFGETARSGASASVPEPATAVLLMLTTLCWCLRQRRAA